MDCVRSVRRGYAITSSIFYDLAFIGSLNVKLPTIRIYRPVGVQRLVVCCASPGKFQPMRRLAILFLVVVLVSVAALWGQ